MEAALRVVALPLLLLIDEVFGAARTLHAGDIQNMLFVLRIGRNSNMGHLTRTHRVLVAWLHQQHARGVSSVLCFE